MKERILLAIKDEGLREVSASDLNKLNYLVTKASTLSEMESLLHGTPQDVLLIESTLWLKTRPDLITKLRKSQSELSIVHLLSEEDRKAKERISTNGEENVLMQPVTGKEILLIVGQAIRYRQLMNRYQQMRSEFLDANKNLSQKTREFQGLLTFNSNILECVNVGIMTIDKEFIVTSWNPMMVAITGIESSKALGAFLFTLTPSLNSGKVAERIKSVILDAKTIELGHIKGKRADGAEIFADYKVSPILIDREVAGAVITVDDTTQKVLLKNELERAQRYISHLVEHSADAIISYDLEGIIVTWNKGAEAMFGYTAQETIGRSWEILVQEKDRKGILNLLQWIKKSGSISNYEIKMATKSGGPIPTSLTISLIKDAKGEIYGFSCIFKDLSDTKRLQKQLINSQKVISLGAMASGVAHDINNPLTSLSAYTEGLITDTEKIAVSDLTSRLVKVEADADRISKMVKDLLWYSSASGQAWEVVDIHSLLEKSINFSGYQADMRGIEVKQEYNARRNLVMGDGRELMQAFINLLTNAAAAMPDGGVITLQTLDEQAPDQEYIVIKISDTGIGIPGQNLPQIFDQFFTTKPAGKGNGLGLYVVNSIIEGHNGRIEVESEVNKGTCFTISLPVKAIPTEQNEKSVEEEG